MRRGYFSNGQSGGISGVQKRAMEQYTRTREKIERDHPDLLESVRRRISSPPDMDSIRAGEEKIDLRKNLKTVLTFIETSGVSTDAQSKIQHMILNIKA
jgi:hypothetical protein